MSDASRQYFEAMFNQPTKMPKFKARVSTSADRWKARGFSSNATFLEGFKAVLQGRTNYEVILRDINKLEAEGHGSVALVANPRFLIDANHASVGEQGAGTLAFMHSTMKPSIPADQLYQPVHRLLVEEDVFAFSWSPVLSPSYYVVMGIISAAKLASAVVSTVGSLGAAAPALIDQIGSAASTLKDVIALVGGVKEVASLLVEGGATIKEEYSAARDHFQAASDPSAAGVGSKVAAAQATDLGARTAKVTPGTKTYFGGLYSRPETEEETRKRVGREMLELEEEVQKLNFVVVQRVTPVLQIRDNIDVTDPQKPIATFQAKTYMAKHALVRAGETTRDKFAQMVMAWKTETFNEPDAAKLFCRPWAAEGIYLQWKDNGGGSIGTEASDQDFGTLNWELDSSWTLMGERAGTLTLPRLFDVLKRTLEERARARASQRLMLQVQINNKMQILAGKARVTVAQNRLADEQKRLADAQNRLDSQRRLIQASSLPSVQDFQNATTTYSLGGRYKNDRSNQKLLTIDTYLGSWFRVKQSPASIDRAIFALECIIGACGEYLAEKNAATLKTGNHSQRIPAVSQLKQAAESLCQQLA